MADRGVVLLWGEGSEPTGGKASTRGRAGRRGEGPDIGPGTSASRTRAYEQDWSASLCEKLEPSRSGALRSAGKSCDLGIHRNSVDAGTGCPLLPMKRAPPRRHGVRVNAAARRSRHTRVEDLGGRRRERAASPSERQRRPPGDPPRRAVIDGRLARICRAAAELGVLDLFPEAAIMQVEVVEARLRRQYVSTGRCRVWWRPLHPLGCTGGAISTEQFHSRIRPDNAMGFSRKQWLWSPNRAGVGLTTGDAAT